MELAFSAQRWETVKRNYRAWWAGKLQRPLIHVTVGGYEAKRAKPDIPWHWFQSWYELSVPAEKIVDWYEYNLETTRFPGDSFPHVNPYFGPGVAAAFMGAKVVNTRETGTTWFEPRQSLAAMDLRLKHDPQSPWWPRVRDLAAAAAKRFQGMVQIDMTDLGGNLDLVATFRPGEELLFDLYDQPAEVERLAWEAHEMWWYYFDELSRATPRNPGYTAWTPILSEQPYYMLQCDFCYMIGPDMFDRFVKPELAATCKRLTNGFYHLDGPGQLPHLDSLLEIPELKGVQWVPGDGQPDITKWPEVYRKIRKAGKLVQFFHSQSKHGLRNLDILADQLGSAEGLIMVGGVDRKQEDELNELLGRYGVE
jgi:5-methyltetrahydrofolate--homocysteine methyltransferase